MKLNYIKIVAIGDSITYGYPYENVQSWLNMAADRFNIEYMNRGINGDTTEGMLDRFERDVLRHKTSHVIIMGGTNDAYAGTPVDQVIKNICDMVGLALENGVIPVIGLPIPCNDVAEETLMNQYRQQMRRYASDKNIEVIDFQDAMVDSSGMKIKDNMHCDGVHPNEVGYETMADVAGNFFLKTLVDARVHDYYWNDDFSCAITTLKILSEIYRCDLQPQVMEAAYGLNAGRLASQCGLVEGALMFIGVYARQRGYDGTAITELCHKFSRNFQAEFGSVLCKELRPEGFSLDNPPHLCENLTKRAVTFSVRFVGNEV